MTSVDDNLVHLAEHIEHTVALLQLRMGAVRDEAAATELVMRIEALAASMAAREAAHPELACVVLARRLGLTVHEQHVVWVLCAIALSSAARELVMQASRASAPDPTLEALRAVTFGERPTREALAALGPEGALRRFGVIERSDGGGAAVHPSRWTWAVSPRVLAWLHGAGDDACDGAREAGELAVRDGVVAELEAALGGRGVVMLAGLPSSGRRTLLAAVASRRGREVQVVEGKRLAKESDPEGALRGIALACRLGARWPLVTNVDALSEAQRDAVGTVLAPLVEGPVLVTCGAGARVRIEWGRPVIAIELGAPSAARRAALWLGALGCGSEEDGAILAAHYPLAPGMIVRAAEVVRARVGERAVGPEDITAGMRTVLEDRFGGLARRITVTQRWEDVVLRREQREALSELAARVRARQRVYDEWGFAAKVGRGLGVSALLSGPPGTGKTMVAGVLANQLGLDLYQVDVAQVVSKFIGETERNLGAVFDAAEAGHAIVLFDEADALFGRRTEVKSSNDRYANLETNYLLQRLESFTGICLLTSNHESHLDPAFQRRLSLHLRFELPDAEERAELWRATLPPAAPVAPGIDFGGLGRRFAMSGGYIRNATLRAAFLAADQDGVITGAHLEHAAQVEYESMGKLAA